uniref:MFS transporter family protein n=1 Tax=Chlorobium chlorochromatii (strain CaD3) TaxID=340177 RepID=Q3AS26_CHLCH
MQRAFRAFTLRRKRLQAQRNYQILFWLLFDFANTAFSVMMVTFVFPLYFKNVICSAQPYGDALWGLSISVSMLLVALVSPFLGAAADVLGRRKHFLLMFTLAAVVGTALLSLTGAGMATVAVGLFIMANMGFEGGIVFYDAYLKELASERSVGRLSGYGFAMGYLGALSILLLVSPLLADGINVANAAKVQQSFLVAATFFALFAAPLFFVIRDRRSLSTSPHPSTKKILSTATSVKNVVVATHHVERKIFGQGAWRNLLQTVQHIRRYPDLARFLLACFFYNDAILTVIAFASLYAEQTLGFSSRELMHFFMVVQIAAMVGALFIGFIADTIGAKRALVVTLILWIGVIAAALFAESKELFFYTGMLAGISMGSSQAASRSMMTRLTPQEHVTEFFGFYDGTFGKASAIVGPFLFGVISSQAGSQKVALSSLLIFFAIGLVLLTKVKSSSTNVPSLQ